MVFLLNSCSDRPPNILPTSTETTDGDLDFASLIAKQTGGAQDLASFLNSGNEVLTINVIDGADEEKISEKPIIQFNLLPLPPESKVVAPSKMLDSYEQHAMPKSPTSLDDNFQISLQELRSLNARKDQTIASLTRLNEELLLELQRSRTLTSVPSEVVGIVEDGRPVTVKASTHVKPGEPEQRRHILRKLMLLRM